MTSCGSGKVSATVLRCLDNSRAVIGSSSPQAQPGSLGPRRCPAHSRNRATSRLPRRTREQVYSPLQVLLLPTRPVLSHGLGIASENRGTHAGNGVIVYCDWPSPSRAFSLRECSVPCQVQFRVGEHCLARKRSNGSLDRRPLIPAAVRRNDQVSPRVSSPTVVQLGVPGRV